MELRQICIPFISENHIINRAVVTIGVVSKQQLPVKKRYNAIIICYRTQSDKNMCDEWGHRAISENNVLSGHILPVLSSIKELY